MRAINDEMTVKMPAVIIYKESLAQSLMSDIVTFGLILLWIWVSRDSTWWTFFTGCMCLVFIVARALEVTKSDRCIRFYSLDDMRKWIDKQEAIRALPPQQ